MNNGPMWKKKERKKNFLEPTASLYDVRTYAINRHIMRDQLRVSSEITRNLENEGPLVNRFFSGEKKTSLDVSTKRIGRTVYEYVYEVDSGMNRIHTRTTNEHFLFHKKNDSGVGINQDYSRGKARQWKRNYPLLSCFALLFTLIILTVLRHVVWTCGTRQPSATKKNGCPL